MRMLSGRMHWLTVGLALLVSAQGLATRSSYGQAPYGPPGGMQMGGYPGGMMGPDGPASMVFEGPAPMDAEMMYSNAGPCDAYGGMGGCATCGGGLCAGNGCGCAQCGNGLCGGRGCGLINRLRACACGGLGCLACGDGGCLFSGRMMSMLGPLAPYCEGGSNRWFDVYAGTIGLSRISNFGGFQTGIQDPVTGEFAVTDIISTQGIAGTPVLRTNDLDMDKMRYGLELIGNIQCGAGANVELRYFGLNNWNTSETVRLNSPDLFSVFSIYGTDPNGGFDDTDRSFVHTIDYSSELNNGEINYRRRWNSPFAPMQGSWLAGIRYFDLDESFGFAATGSNDNTFTFNQLRFANYNTITRNQLTGFQVGGDMWLCLMPGVQAGVEGKAGIFGNHAEVESQIISNSVPGAREFLQDGKTAYLCEFSTSLVYRLTYCWSVKTSYNLLWVDNVALAPENINARDFGNALGGGSFTAERFPFINVDGEVLYSGWSIGGEFTF